MFEGMDVMSPGDTHVFEGLEQNTDEWLKLRLGIPTASVFVKMMASGRGEGTLGQGAITLMYDLITERITGRQANEMEFLPKAIQWGNDHEDEARAAYQFAVGTRLKQVGFVIKCIEDGIFVGASPDAMASGEDEGGVEIKCPFNSTNHLKWMEAGGVPDAHFPQVQGLMWVTGRKWWDFVSYDPRMPQGLKLYAYREEADEDYHRELELRAIRFSEQMLIKCAKLQPKFK